MSILTRLSKFFDSMDTNIRIHTLNKRLRTKQYSEDRILKKLSAYRIWRMHKWSSDNVSKIVEKCIAKGVLQTTISNDLIYEDVSYHSLKSILSIVHPTIVLSIDSIISRYPSNKFKVYLTPKKKYRKG